MYKHIDVKSIDYELLVNLKQTIVITHNGKEIALIVPMRETKENINNEGPMGAQGNQ